MKKVMIIFGTRPEAIKMAPLCHLLKTQENFETIVCVTGQHRQMLDQVLDIFELIPDLDLDIMKQNQDLFDVTSSVLIGLREIFLVHKPDLVLIHGDTTTAFASSLAAFYSGIRIGHVEAGLRTHDLYAPFPEELNRKVASILTNLHFAPTEESRQNLISEGVEGANIVVTGNTVVDALFWMIDRLESNEILRDRIIECISNQLSFDWMNTRYVLITGHRRENFGEGFENICKALVQLAAKFPSINFVYPVHLNPQVQTVVNKLLSGYSNIHLIPPQDYEPFVMLLKHCYLVLTDSGGIQEEAPSLGKPVLVMRETTERPEGIKAGTVKLVGTSKKDIIDCVSVLIEDKDLYSKMSESTSPYGDGEACSKILKGIMEAIS
jgi:UDP-N-acetylglucosamine 2-epimerase (non-hydrolysing)